jgi:hypothetical protein
MGEYHPYLEAAKRDISAFELERAHNTLVSIVSKEETCAEAWYLLASIEVHAANIVQFLRKALLYQKDYPEAEKLLSDLQQKHHIKPLQVMMIQTGSTAVGKTCPFCFAHFRLSDKVIVCPKCKRTHHYHCWEENGCACAGKFCDGFSVSELKDEPLPSLPDQSEVRLIIIREEDIVPGAAGERQKREALFLLKMLISNVSAEQGLISQQSVVGLPSIDELIDLIKQSRDSLRQSGHHSSPGQVVKLPKFCLNCGKQFPRAESRFCPYCGVPRTVTP